MKTWAARRLRRWANRLAPITIPRSWSGDSWVPSGEGYKQANLVIETDGLYTGTTLTINGQPVHNCIGVSFEIKAGEFARATVELEDVPVLFRGGLDQSPVI